MKYLTLAFILHGEPSLLLAVWNQHSIAASYQRIWYWTSLRLAEGLSSSCLSALFVSEYLELQDDGAALFCLCFAFARFSLVLRTLSLWFTKREMVECAVTLSIWHGRTFASDTYLKVSLQVLPAATAVIPVVLSCNSTKTSSLPDVIW